LLGSYGAMKSPIPYPAPVTYLHVHLHDQERWTFTPHAGHDVAWLAVSRGGLEVAGTRVVGEMIVFEEGGGAIDVTAIGEVDFVIASAVKHPHPLVTGMYSVHTSRANLAIGERGYAEVAETMSLTPWRPLNASHKRPTHPAR